MGKGLGDTIEVVVWKDESTRTVEAPAELTQLLKKERLLAAFEKLSYTNPKEYVRWITGAEREEARLKRVTKAVAMIRSGVRMPE